MSRARTLLVSLFLLASPLAAQQSPNKEHGFAPEKAYHLGEIDSVNAFNGNLVVTLPVGSTWPVAADLGFGLTLVYNSSLWEQRMPGSPGAPYTDPNPIFNAGLGWRLSLGELLPASHPSNHTPFWVYVGPDGAHHPFGDEGGVFQSLTGPGTPAPTQGTVVAYTQDGSYLRLTSTPGASPPLLLELPGGTRHRFDAEGRLVKIENRSGVGVAISYGTNTWTATDAHGRQVQVVFQNRAGVMIRKVVTQVLVPSFDGTQKSYDFSYEDRELPRGCPNDDGYGAVRVPLLKRIDRPDGTRFDLPVSTSYVTKTGNVCLNESGLLLQLSLPSLGRLQWDYENFLFPSADLPDRCRDFFSNGPGVMARHQVDADGQTTRTWTYNRVLDFPTCIRPPGPTDPSRWVRTIVTDPLGHQTEQHFSVSIVDDGGWKVNEYGLPITHAEPGSNGRLLSKRIRNASGTLLRSEYLSYSIDTASVDLPGAKHQLTGSRTVFHDDGGKFVDRAFSDFDGLGHFRTMTHSDDFGLGGSPHVETTAWNPTRGSQGSWAPPGPSEPWILDVYTEKQASEASSTVLAEASFDANGRLACVRRRLSATARDVHDVVVTYAYDASGNPTEERWHGATSPRSARL